MPCTTPISGKLLIPTTATDTGTRPINPCDNFWASPDLILVGGVDQSTVKIGQTVQVQATVSNISKTDTVKNVQVDVWVCNFSAGPLGPSTSIASANPGGFAMNASLGDLSPGATSMPVTVGTWKPAPGDTSFNTLPDGSGHVCLAGNCYAGDGSDGNANLPSAGIQPCCDSHHAQHNVTIQPAPMGMGRKINFKFVLTNPDVEREANFVLTAHTVQERPALVGIARRYLIPSPHIEIATLEDRPQLALARPALEAEAAHVPLVFARTAPQLHLRNGGGDGEPPVREIRQVVPPRQQVPMTLETTFSPQEPVGSFHVVDLRTRDQQGDIVGGARVIFLLTR